MMKRAGRKSGQHIPRPTVIEARGAQLLPLCPCPAFNGQGPSPKGQLHDGRNNQIDPGHLQDETGQGRLGQGPAGSDKDLALKRYQVAEKADTPHVDAMTIKEPDAAAHALV